MSAVQTSERFQIVVKRSGSFRYCVWGPDGIADMFRTPSAAEYFARLLNNGLAAVNPHAVVGCRVEVK